MRYFPVIIPALLTWAICSAAPAQDTAPPATQPARPSADVPITEVALFKSGVGFFKHTGSVEGNASTELHFKTDQISDILKSLALQDGGGGHIGTVVYPSQDPVERTLHRFQVDISSDPPLELLLQQLRGARVQVYKGDDKIAGQIIGLQQKERSLPQGTGNKVIHPWFLNVLSESSVHSIALDDVAKIEFLEPELQKDFAAALTTLAKARDQNNKTVTVNFEGQGKRHVAFAYLLETPLGKISYRLILPEIDATGKQTDPAAKATLQGWALVENQTDADWSNVKLSLIGGRPISFIQDLYESLYSPRPVYEPEFIGSLNAQTYEGGTPAKEGEVATPRGASAGAGGGTGLFSGQPGGNAPTGEQRSRFDRTIIHRGGQPSVTGGVGGAATAGDGEFHPEEGVKAIANPEQLGESFRYAIERVNLKRGQSAMLPVVADPVEVQRVSIFNSQTLPKNPLYGARLKNTTGKYLLAGPFSVRHGGAYAGDASILDVPMGASRLLSYGVDQDVLVETEPIETSKLRQATISDGALRLWYDTKSGGDYTATSTSDVPKLLLIEEQRQSKDDVLVAPAKATETTDGLYRLELPIPAHHSAKLRVEISDKRMEAIELASLTSEELDKRINNKDEVLPPKVRAALTDLLNRLLLLEREKAEIDAKKAQRQAIGTDQTRIRENIKVADHNDQVYQRLQTKLNNQETQIETLEKEMADLQTAIEKQQKELKTFIETTKVED